MLAYAYARLGHCAREFGNEERAQEHFERALSLDPDAPDAFLTHYGIAETHVARSDFAAAEPHLTFAAEYGPETFPLAPDWWALLGQCHYRRAEAEMDVAPMSRILQWLEDAARCFRRSAALLADPDAPYSGQVSRARAIWEAVAAEALCAKITNPERADKLFAEVEQFAREYSGDVPPSALRAMYEQWATLDTRM